MVGLIEEIQRDAADRDVPIDATLRRVKLAAAKLSLGTLETWVNEELQGYSGEVPDYREVCGQPAAWNPHNGWIPLQADDERLINLFSTVPLQQSVGSLVDALKHNDSGIHHFPLPLGIVNFLNEFLNFQTPRAVVQLSRGQLIMIIDTVRDMVLDWSIQMEAQGIVGDGLSFSPHEKLQAKNSMTTIKIGHIENFAGNLGSDQIAQDISLSTDAKADIISLVNELESSFSNFVAIVGVDEKRLRNALDACKSEVGSSSPKDSVIR